MTAIKNNLVPNNIATKVISAGKNSMQYITIHETGNTAKGADANAHANLQANGNSRQASWHITVDDKQAIRSFLDTSVCWHAGASYPQTSGNPRSIGIEICVNSDGDFTTAVKNAASVTAQLMLLHNIPIGRVVQHNHWSGKNCPENLRSGRKGITWQQFKQFVLDEYAGKTVAAVDKAKEDDDELKFSSPSARALWETMITSKAQREIVIQAAVDAGYSKAWIKDLEDGKIEPGDFAGLMAGTLIKMHKQNK
ncbi:N-acetylmuramoyl-L-alanine amidase family protein [Sporosarcina sp. NCCP-2331]|nr:N-acetylmuramoyl-L-alanine amidase [Sporosarcina sp. NCCP-2331]GKV64666.1 hypothetical protein NCCP2331_08190 [Sporosarcina sp. NCCP-2331]GLB54461.1 hypothetical protein NCCP2378_02460 [Sporosarcina sp. NCCP-2378]